MKLLHPHKHVDFVQLPAAWSELSPLVLAKVVGYDNASLGLPNSTWPLLALPTPRTMVAATQLSCAAVAPPAAATPTLLCAAQGARAWRKRKQRMRGRRHATRATRAALGMTLCNPSADDAHLATRRSNSTFW